MMKLFFVKCSLLSIETYVKTNLIWLETGDSSNFSYMDIASMSQTKETKGYFRMKTHDRIIGLT